MSLQITYIVQKRILLFAMAALVIELVLFTAYFRTNIAPYYPAAFDQSVTYNAVYEAYYVVQEHGWTQALQADLAIKEGAFKGWSVPTLGLGLALIFGPQRDVIGLANFVFFALGQIAIWQFLSKRHGTPTALLGWGLFLLAGTHYYWAGGIDDMRFDYAGMVIFGIAFLLLLSIFEMPTLPKCWIFVLMFGIAASTRSITIIYLLGMIGALFLIVGGRWLTKRDDTQNWDRLKFLFFLGVISVLVAGAFIAANWRALSDYYINAKVSSEDAIRKAESGITSLLGLLLYYPGTSVLHFANYFLAAAASVVLWLGVRAGRQLEKRPDRGEIIRTISLLPILVGTLAFAIYVIAMAYTSSWRSAGFTVAAVASIVFLLGMWWRRRIIQTVDRHELWRRVSATVTVSGAALIAVYITVTSYFPSPVVIGVLTIPLVIALTVLLVECLTPLLSSRAFEIGVLVVALLGLANYGSAMILPRNSALAVQGDGVVVNQVLSDMAHAIKPGKTTSIYWLLVHPGLMSLVLNIYLYEHNGSMLVSNLRYVPLTIFPVSATELMKNLGQADIVVAFDPVPPKRGFEYPFDDSVRAAEPIWQTYLAEHYRNEHTYDFANDQWKVGLFIQTENVK